MYGKWRENFDKMRGSSLELCSFLTEFYEYCRKGLKTVKQKSFSNGRFAVKIKLQISYKLNIDNDTTNRRKAL